MREAVYDRETAVAYAHEWAGRRNPQYVDFDRYGGDCTNFISQILFAGAKVMNMTREYGWYYIDVRDRTPSWSGVEFLYRFLVNNRGAGPYAVMTDLASLLPGDIIQLNFDGGFYDHSLAVVQTGSPATPENTLIATHTFDSDNRRLSTYHWKEIRYLHIAGVRRP